MSTITKGTSFPAQLVSKLFSNVTGHSSIAKLSGQEPIPFNGKDLFTFDFSNEVSVVGESGAKPSGDATKTPVQIRPIKVVYQSRVSDEFLMASEEARMNILESFAEGFTKKIAKGLDIMVMHGVNPATGLASDVIGNNNLDYIIANYSSGGNIITLGHDSSAIDTNIEEAIAKVEDAEKVVSGIIIAPATRTAMANLTQNSGERKYNDFAFGGAPANLGSAKLDVNATVSSNSNKARAYVGDFADKFKWGFAKNMPLEIIEYGDPDGSGHDLKQYNEVCLRSEAYIGWGFLDASSFAEVKQGE